MAAMADTTAVARGTNGGAVVLKRGDPERLRHEVAMLRLAAHPGVVALADAPEGEGGLDRVLCTAFVGGGTLAERVRRPVDPRTAVAVAASLSSTLADLHDRRIAHRRVSADHVLVGDGRAVVCGLAEAVPVEDGDAAALGDDVAAAARLVEDLAAATAEPQATALRQVARRVLASSPEGRPSMRGLAGALAALAPDGDPAPAPPGGGGRALRPRSGGGGRHLPARGAVGALGAAGVAVVALAAGTVALLGAGLLRSGRTAPEVVAAPVTVPPAPPVTVTTPTSTPGPRRLWPRSACPATPPPEGVDVDGDGCEDEVEVHAGVVSSADGRWQVAAPGDVVTLGDWDCDGRATPAVLRPPSGRLWIFDRWADDGEQVAAVPAGVVGEAAGARTVGPLEGAAPGCDRIEVLHPDDTSTVVTPPHSPAASPERSGGLSAGGRPPRWPATGRRG